MKKHISLDILLFLILLAFSSCKIQATENETQSFEWEVESSENSGVNEKTFNEFVKKYPRLYSLQGGWE